MTAMAPSSPMSCQLWRNDAADDVGRKLEFQSEEQPHAETPPELLACTERGPGCGNDPEQFGECLECSVRDDENSGDFDQEGSGARDLFEQLLHALPPRAHETKSRARRPVSGNLQKSTAFA